MLGVLAPALLLVACGPQSQPSATAHSAAAATTTASPPATAVPLPPAQPPDIHVDATGASVANSGLLAVAVISNPSADRAGAHVTVTFTAASSNGKPAVTGTAEVATLAAGETQAVTVTLAVPGDDHVGDVSAVASAASSASSSPPDFHHDPPVFHADAHGTGVQATVTNGSGITAQAIAVAVCYNASGGIIGGGQTGIRVPAAGAASVDIPVAVSDSPAKVAVFVRSAA